MGLKTKNYYTMKKLYLFASILLIAVLSGCGGDSTSKSGSEVIKETTTITRYSADTPEGALNLFLEKLGQRDYAGAHDLQKNKEWGTLEKFSSTKAFGGIVKTTVQTMDLPKDEAGKKMIYAEVTYQDEVNGDNTFKQKFYLSSFGGSWKIVDMKVVKGSETEKKDSNSTFEIQGEFESNFGSYHREIDIIGMDDNFNHYKFQLSYGNDTDGDVLKGDFYVESNTAYWSETYDDGTCSLRFTFSPKKIEIEEVSNSGKCYGHFSVAGKYNLKKGFKLR